MSQAVPRSYDTTKSNKLYLAFELSAMKWKLGFSEGSGKMLEKNIAAGDLASLELAIARMKKRLDLPQDAIVVSCYEAGRDGFWIHRELVRRGIQNIIVDPASIAVARQKRRKKTDRIDVIMLMANLVRYDRGDRNVWSVLRVPSLVDEDNRRPHRELMRLKKERTAHNNRIRSLLALFGIRLSVTRKFVRVLQSVRCQDGTLLPTQLMEELFREYERYELTNQHITLLCKNKRASLRQPQTINDRKVIQLMSLYGVGEISADVLVNEFFGWRTFKNRREVAGAVGLTPTPHQSGTQNTEQGISKAGNPRIRSVLIELGWQWLRYQPNSPLTTWYQSKFGHGSGRMRRIGIVALARRLLIVFWRFVEQGIYPDGVRTKSALVH